MIQRDHQIHSERTGRCRRLTGGGWYTGWFIIQDKPSCESFVSTIHELLSLCHLSLLTEDLLLDFCSQTNRTHSIDKTSIYSAHSSQQNLPLRLQFQHVQKATNNSVLSKQTEGTEQNLQTIWEVIPWKTFSWNHRNRISFPEKSDGAGSADLHKSENTHTQKRDCRHFCDVYQHKITAEIHDTTHLHNCLNSNVKPIAYLWFIVLLVEILCFIQSFCFIFCFYCTKKNHSQTQTTASLESDQYSSILLLRCSKTSNPNTKPNITSWNTFIPVNATQSCHRKDMSYPGHAKGTTLGSLREGRSGAWEVRMISRVVDAAAVDTRGHHCRVLVRHVTSGQLWGRWWQWWRAETVNVNELPIFLSDFCVLRRIQLVPHPTTWGQFLSFWQVQRM